MDLLSVFFVGSITGGLVEGIRSVLQGKTFWSGIPKTSATPQARPQTAPQSTGSGSGNMDKLQPRTATIPDAEAPQLRSTSGTVESSQRLQTGKILETPGEKAVSKFRVEPRDFAEKLAMDEAMSGRGDRIMKDKIIKDPIWKDWHKIEHLHYRPNGKEIKIHYWRNPITDEVTGFKFK